MRPLVRRLLWLVALVVVMLLVAKVLVTLPRFAERWLSERTGLHVTMHGAGVRLVARAFVMNDVRFALDENSPPFLRLGELDWYVGQQLLAITDPVVDLSPAGGSTAGSVEPVTGHIEPGRLQISGARIREVDREGTEHDQVLPPVFVEHRGIDFERSLEGWTLRSEVTPGLGRIGVEAAWERRDGGLTWRLVANLEHVDVPDLGARGAVGRVVYERSAIPLEPREHLSGDVTLADISIAAGRGAVSGHAGLRLEGMSIDLRARRFQSERLVLHEGEAVLQPEVEGSLLPLPAGWTVAAANVDVEQLRVRVGRLPTLGIASLSLRDVGSTTPWPLAITGRFAGGGTVEASGDVEPSTKSFTGSLTLTDIELASWVNPFFPHLEVGEGRLDARLSFDGRPGLGGMGAFTVHDLLVKARRAPKATPLPLLSVRTAHIADVAFTLAPESLRVGDVRLESPTLMVRHEETGWGLNGVLGSQDESARQARAVLGGLARRLPRRPIGPQLGDGRMAAQVQARDLVVEVTDAATQPPLTVRLARAEATGEVLAEAPWSWRRIVLQGRVEEAAPLELRIERDQTRVSAHGRLGPGPLEPWNPQLARLLGHVARAGRARLDASLDWKTDVEASVGVMLDGVIVEPTAGDNPVVGMLGLPLARTLSLLTDPAGPTEFSVRVPGDASAPALGLPGVLEDTLRRTLTDAIVVPLFDAASLHTENRIEYVRLAPLAFAVGESTLSETAVDTLDRLATLLHGETGWMVFVQGRDGTEEEQPSETVTLADERAAAVRHHLTMVRGIPDEQVEVEAPGTGTPSVRLDLLPAR